MKFVEFSSAPRDTTMRDGYFEIQRSCFCSPTLMQRFRLFFCKSNISWFSISSARVAALSAVKQAPETIRKLYRITNANWCTSSKLRSTERTRVSSEHCKRYKQFMYTSKHSNQWAIMDTSTPTEQTRCHNDQRRGSATLMSTQNIPSIYPSYQRLNYPWWSVYPHFRQNLTQRHT